MTSIRIGNGYDIHQLSAGRPLILGGGGDTSRIGVTGA